MMSDNNSDACIIIYIFKYLHFDLKKVLLILFINILSIHLHFFFIIWQNICYFFLIIYIFYLYLFLFWGIIEALNAMSS